jgi:hypothetical protein
VNAEGVGGVVTPEWIQAIATGLLVLVVAGWIPAWLGDLWRHTAWKEAGAALTEVAQALGAPILPSRWGWRIEARDGAVEVAGGIQGLRTTVVRGHQVVEAEGALPAAEILRLLA